MSRQDEPLLEIIDELSAISLACDLVCEALEGAAETLNGLFR